MGCARAAGRGAVVTLAGGAGPRGGAERGARRRAGTGGDGRGRGGGSWGGRRRACGGRRRPSGHGAGQQQPRRRRRDERPGRRPGRGAGAPGPAASPREAHRSSPHAPLLCPSPTFPAAGPGPLPPRQAPPEPPPQSGWALAWMPSARPPWTAPSPHNPPSPMVLTGSLRPSQPLLRPTAAPLSVRSVVRAPPGAVSWTLSPSPPSFTAHPLSSPSCPPSKPSHWPRSPSPGGAPPPLLRSSLSRGEPLGRPGLSPFPQTPLKQDFSHQTPHWSVVPRLDPLGQALCTQALPWLGACFLAPEVSRLQAGLWGLRTWEAHLAWESLDGLPCTGEGPQAV